MNLGEEAEEEAEPFVLCLWEMNVDPGAATLGMYSSIDSCTPGPLGS